jgi:hypothetical protein
VVEVSDGPAIAEFSADAADIVMVLSLASVNEGVAAGVAVEIAVEIAAEDTAGVAEGADVIAVEATAGFSVSFGCCKLAFAPVPVVGKSEGPSICDDVSSVATDVEADAVEEVDVAEATDVVVDGDVVATVDVEADIVTDVASDGADAAGEAGCGGSDWASTIWTGGNVLNDGATKGGSEQKEETPDGGGEGSVLGVSEEAPSRETGMERKVVTLLICRDSDKEESTSGFCKVTKRRMIPPMTVTATPSKICRIASDCFVFLAAIPASPLPLCLPLPPGNSHQLRHAYRIASYVTCLPGRKTSPAGKHAYRNARNAQPSIRICIPSVHRKVLEEDSRKMSERLVAVAVKKSRKYPTTGLAATL